MSLKTSFMQSYLETFDEVPFKVNFKNGSSFKVGKDTPKFEVTFNDEISKKELLTSTSLALGEAYMDRRLEIDGDLFYVLNLFLGQMNKFVSDEHCLKKLIHPPTSQKTQKQEVCYHYNIGNDFYKLWLDETLSYSCAYFNSENDTLFNAQVNKVDYILKKLNLKEGMSLLDIGCGWGFLLIEAAKKYNIKGTGITLSEEQYKEFKRRIEAENLQDKLSVELMDYRKLSKTDMKFDRVVSVGMLEHVGRENYSLYMKNIDSVLKPEGIFLLHYISGLKENCGDPWMCKYIFPGGMVPSLREIINIAGDINFFTIDVESLRRHYVKTLLCWLNNFNNNMDKIKDMFDDKFIRMWELYLCACAATFNNGIIDLHQILFTKGANNNLPMTRDYLYK